MLISSAYIRNTVSLARGRVSRQAPRPTETCNRLCLNASTSTRPFTAAIIHTTRTRAGINLKWSARFVHTRRSKQIVDIPYNNEKEHVHRILTFNPQLFSVVGQEMINFSLNRWVYAGIIPSWVVFSYPADPPAKKDNFPPGTRGYLYYQKPLPGEHGMSGGLRFRCMPAGGASFDDGKDLLHKDGLPWKVPLYNIVHFKAYAPVLEALLLEGSVSEELVTYIKQLPVRRFSRRSAILYEASDTFIADLSRSPRFVHLVMPGSVITIDSFISRVFYCKSSGTSPFLGRLRLCLERSTLPQHADSYHATVRVVEILEPIQRMVPGDDFEIAEPVEGELIRRRSSLGTEYKIYTCKLSGSTSDILSTFFNGEG